MAAIKRAADELFALFVDDGLLAASALAWVAVVTLVVPRLVDRDGACALLLFAGLAVLLLISTLRRAGRTRS